MSNTSRRATANGPQVREGFQWSPRLTVSSSSCSYHFPVDIWALGVVTYVMLCGCAPFDVADKTSKSAYCVETSRRSLLALCFGSLQLIFVFLQPFPRKCINLSSLTQPCGATFRETARSFFAIHSMCVGEGEGRAKWVGQVKCNILVLHMHPHDLHPISCSLS